MKISKTTTRNLLQGSGFLRLNQVLSLIPVSKTTWYEGIRQGMYPQPIKISLRTSAWRVEEIRDLINSMGEK